MRDAEFDQLLDVVRSSMDPDAIGSFFENDGVIAPPIAANDNDSAWPHLPFPKDWIASC